ncbi:MAG: hypothetical protein QOE43_2354 [Gaiellaceae bacterium]|jgi:hypothetical protein|nr:hypothetical protein [Gaiellaceae bacterium]
MDYASLAATVLSEVATWAGITTQPTPRGATAIVFEGHELGHVHSNRGRSTFRCLPTDARKPPCRDRRRRDRGGGRPPPPDTRPHPPLGQRLAQYTSMLVGKTLRDSGILQSMGSVGDPWTTPCRSPGSARSRRRSSPATTSSPAPKRACGSSTTSTTSTTRSEPTAPSPCSARHRALRICHQIGWDYQLIQSPAQGFTSPDVTENHGVGHPCAISR